MTTAALKDSPWSNVIGKGDCSEEGLQSLQSNLVIFSFSFARSRIFRICIREDKKAMKQYRTNRITP